MSLKKIVGSHFANYREAWEANRLVAKGKIHPTLSRTYTLEETGQAAYDVHRNLHQGKVGVLAPGPARGPGRHATRSCAPSTSTPSTASGTSDDLPGTERAAARARKDRPWLMRTYAGHSTARGVQRAVPAQPRQGPDRAVGRLRPADADRLRPRPRPRPRRGRPGRRPGLAPRRHAAAVPGHPAGADEHLDDHQRHRDVAAGALPGGRRGAGRRGVGTLQGTTQNDIVKEYLSRGTHVFPPGPSLRLTTDMIAYTVAHMPKWNPINICSYHLQEAGATPVQEIAYAMSTADRGAGRGPRLRPGARRSGWATWSARISFFVNAGVRFVEEMCKMRAFDRHLGHRHPGALRHRGPASSAASATACRSTRSA